MKSNLDDVKEGGMCQSGESYTQKNQHKQVPEGALTPGVRRMERSQCVWKGVREIGAVRRTQILSLRIW